MTKINGSSGSYDHVINSNFSVLKNDDDDSNKDANLVILKNLATDSPSVMLYSREGYDYGAHRKNGVELYYCGEGKGCKGKGKGWGKGGKKAAMEAAEQAAKEAAEQAAKEATEEQARIEAIKQEEIKQEEIKSEQIQEEVKIDDRKDYEQDITDKKDNFDREFMHAERLKPSETKRN